MTEANQALGITEVVLRDAHQSLIATRMRIEDMLPIADKLDQVGFWAVESWGGATFDACIRYLGEDPWERIRRFKAAMPNTRQQMLFRSQTILGYRHYADDVVRKFVERAAVNGVDVFRVFDALNDMRNLETAISAVREQGRHAQGAMAYTTSPVHTLETWLEMARSVEAMGADSLCIKDMAGLLEPYTAFELVTRLKQTVGIPIHIQCHATTGLSTATYLKVIEAGIDNIDTAISSMSLTYGHSPTETMVSMLEGTPRFPGLDLKLLEEIAAYFREARKKYEAFEGSLKGVDSRILVSQVPGGMLSNLENQLREQNALDRLDEVLEEIPQVRADLGFPPLVTPVSQIVVTQAVFNVLSGERYSNIAKETAGVLRGEYGATPVPVNLDLQARVLDGDEPIRCRPADLLKPEFDKQRDELRGIAKRDGFVLSHEVDDTLTFALFPQAGLRFLKNRHNPAIFEPPPKAVSASPPATETDGVYTVEVAGQQFVVKVAEGERIGAVTPAAAAAPAPVHGAGGKERQVAAPLAGTVVRVMVGVGERVETGDVLVILEAMKMEAEVHAPAAGTVAAVRARGGDSVQLGQVLLLLRE
ncbi:MAG: sodium-extruding oxaloacetate decarboxylase subunit alpha [Gammaproteobacteria bacterium]|nr:sodium-extruding oxaloacetate decarboxylase subunit alpha [Gammaproteobacteria bacterium]MCY4270922.1 sodium-extruding oxaloacetate decarboxylase subunit alpha [Gammaproteobacteria bacterium]MCY4296920.1 sodium-extruding oxaloacetate decarboxylase subunit alpha [Gammaproteobacteria bacterium]